MSEWRINSGAGGIFAGYWFPTCSIEFPANGNSLTIQTPGRSIRPGEMAERPIAPVLKTGVPSRVPRVRIPVSPLRQNASKRSVFPQNPEFTRGFFAFMDLGFGPGPSPCPRVPGVQKGENCDNTRKTEWHQSGHLGTTDGTDFPAHFSCLITAHRSRKPVCCGDSKYLQGPPSN